MQVLPVYRGALLCFFWVSLLFSASFCHGSSTVQKVEVVGIGECADCKQNNIKTSQAFSGLRVTIDCKLANGEIKTRAFGELDEEGKFKVSLPEEIVKDDELKEECFAQLHSASATPCPSHNGLENSKLILKTKVDGKHTFSPAGKLKFSPETCTSAFLWPHYKYHPIPKIPKWHKLPPYSKSHPWYKPLPKIYLPPFKFPPKVFPPPVPIYKKPLPPPVPVYEKPLPPPVPVYKKPLPPPVPVYEKPLPPPVPVYKKPLPPPVPVYKKPLPPPVPVYKKPLPPPVPVYKKPSSPSANIQEATSSTCSSL